MWYYYVMSIYVLYQLPSRRRDSRDLFTIFIYNRPLRASQALSGLRHWSIIFWCPRIIIFIAQKASYGKTILHYHHVNFCTNKIVRIQPLSLVSSLVGPSDLPFPNLDIHMSQHIASNHKKWKYARLIFLRRQCPWQSQCSKYAIGDRIWITQRWPKLINCVQLVTIIEL